MSCRLDCCNSLLAGVADVHLRRLQSLQNAAARLVSGARRHDHITPSTLHWLPVRERVTFKTAVLVWNCLHDVAPRYLVDLCVPTAATAGRRLSRSAVSGALMVPWTRTSTGQRTAALYGLRTWNRLLPALPLSELLLSSFKRQLKTHLFQHQCAGCSCDSYIPPSGAVPTVVSSAPIITVSTQLNSTLCHPYFNNKKHRKPKIIAKIFCVM